MSASRRRSTRRISAAAAVPVKTEDYAIRWQPITSTYTPSADIMSSPDPLNDTADESAFFPPSSARRVTRSQLSSRFGSRSVSRSVSPRKQTFELQVGDNSSPQKLLVTVETDEAEPSSVNTRRKLFQSPGSQAGRRIHERATTTTVPLRDEDEPTTPRRRGRPRKSNGTPIPGAGVKRRAGTPMKRTPRRPRSSKASDTDDALSEASAAATPRSTRRGRPPKSKPVEPQSDAAPVSSSVTRTSTRTGGRKRRQAMDQDELIQMADLAVEGASFQDELLPVDDEMDLVMAPRQSIEEIPDELPPPESIAQGSDLWLGGALDDEATPRPRKTISRPASAASSSTRRRNTRSASARSSAAQSTPRKSTTRSVVEPVLEPETHEPPPEADDGDFPDLIPAPSDASSADDLAPAEPTAYRNDTIAQGEDFSMIFMDSIPSLQASFRQSNSGPPPPLSGLGDHELGEETNLIINNTLETLRQEQEAAEEEEEAVEDVDMDFAEPEEPFRNNEGMASATEDALDVPEQSSPFQMEPHGEVSGVPPSPSPEPVEPLNPTESLTRPPLNEGLSPVPAFSPSLARSPRKLASPLRHQVLKFTARQAEHADSSPADQDRLGETARLSSPRRDSIVSVGDDTNMYEDSFSEIPQEVLDAATPRRPTTFASVQEDETNEEEDEIEQEPIGEDEVLDDVDLVGNVNPMEPIPQIQVDQIETLQEAVEEPRLIEPSLASNASVVSQLEAGRLPTPDDTPPHNESEAGNDAEEKSADTSKSSSAQASPIQEVYHEVETVAYTASHRGGGQLPTLSIEEPGPVPKVTPVNQLSSPAQENQSLMPENPQSRSARPTLSPIVRAGRVLQSVTSDPPSPEGRERHLGSPFRSSASKDSKDSRASRRISMSPPRPFHFPAPRSSSVGAAPEDPFQSHSKPTAQSGFLQALNRSIGSAAAHRRTISQESLASSIRHAPPSEEMSWVANEGPISPRLRGDISLKEVAQSSLVGAQKAKDTPASTQLDGPPDEVDEVLEEAEEEQEAPQAKDDETDIWEFEASRNTPRSTRQEPFGRKAPAPILRRGTIPSPWVRPGDNSFATTAREASPELHTDDRDRPVPSSVLPGSEPDEFSLLAEQRRAEEERARANQSPSKGGKFDLSSFFSSPAALPGMLAAKTMSFLGSRPAPEEAVQVPEVPESPEAVERIPVKNPATASLPSSSAPDLTPSERLYPSLPQKEFQPSSSPRRDLFSPVRTAQLDEVPAEATTESPEAPEEIAMPTVAQKQNFTPRPRQSSQTFFQASSPSKPQPPTQQPQESQPQSGARTPPRMQLSHEDIANWRRQTTTASTEETPPFRRPLLRPLPHKNASPTKSSLRSPLKPHTPGRVVEFTSSVLSPVEQAQARQQARGSILGSSLFGEPLTSQPEPQAEDKENRDAHEQPHEPSDVSMTDASPLTKSPVPPPLSETVWTRDHWLLLDELLQLRRQGPFHGDYEHSAESEKLLGKTVRSQGEAMKLERWHLDCVDAFRMEVGDGWDEGVLAKRLFALVLGEERRARGSEEREPKVMFH